jgi:hypothetical protein
MRFNVSMKASPLTIGLNGVIFLMLASMASAQNPDPSKWMCRNLADSGGFTYQGESVFGTVACRPVQISTPATSSPITPTGPSASGVSDSPKQDPASGGPPVADSANGTPAAPKGFRLEDGTPVHLVLSENISSADAVTGQTVEFEVVDDVIVSGFLVIPRGATAWATVTDAEHKRRMGRPGKLDINIDKVRLADGEKAMLRAVKDAKGGSHTGAMVGGIVATSLVLLPAAPLFLLVHGKDVTIPKGTNVPAFVQGDVILDQSKFQKPLEVAK